MQENPEELQRTLDLVETLTKQQQAAAKAKGQSSPPAQNKARKQRQEHGPTAQPDLIEELRSFELDEPDRVCPCGGELCPIRRHVELKPDGRRYSVSPCSSSRCIGQLGP